MSNAVIITVKLKNSSSNPPLLELSDSRGNRPGNEDLVTFVHPGNIITWVRDGSSGISELTDIRLKNEEYGINLLESSIKRNEEFLQGRIVGKQMSKCDRMVYKIGFKIFGDENEYWSDPVIQME